MYSNTHNRNNNKNSPMAKFWSQKQNIYAEGMPQKMNYQKRYMKHMVDLLNEEYHKDRRKKNYLIYTKVKTETQHHQE